ncbi:MAG: hypothetical protein FJY65_07980 [Calditrichaeota bacterium]|nr:hypothetical protein [Calditrichota bacterium]
MKNINIKYKFILLIIFQWCFLQPAIAEAETIFWINIDWQGLGGHDTEITYLKIKIDGTDYQASYANTVGGVSHWKVCFINDPPETDWFLLRPGGALNWAEDEWWEWPNNCGVINVGGENFINIHYVE